MKIVKNNTASIVFVSDTGVSVPASGTYTIPSQDYLLWAASDNIVTYIGNSTVTINDGTSDLSINNGTDLILGNFPSQIKIQGNTTNTNIGNVGDALKTSTNITGGSITATLKFSDIQKNVEFNITAKAETDITGTSYTVTTGKTFYVTSFMSSSDSPSPVSFRLKVYNGATLINSVKINVAGNGATCGFSWENGIIFAQAGYTIKVTAEPQAAKGSGWVMFSGFEV